MQSKEVVRGQAVTKQKLAAARALRKSPTVEESIVWREIRRNQLAGIHFRRQQVIEGWIVDFYCNRAGVAIEIDGATHAKQREYDQERDEALMRRGLIVLRFTNDEVRSNLRGVLDRLAIVCTARGPSGSASPSGDAHRMHRSLTAPLPVKGRGRGRGSQETR